MAIVKSSSPSAAALLLATLLLFAAASAAVAQQTPPEEEEDGPPGCPTDINDIIVMALTDRELSHETVAKFNKLYNNEIYDCICDNFVEATGIKRAPPPGAISSLVKAVFERFIPNSGSSFGECNPSLPNTQ